jgi:hypothetical protein
MGEDGLTGLRICLPDDEWKSVKQQLGVGSKSAPQICDQNFLPIFDLGSMLTYLESMPIQPARGTRSGARTSRHDPLFENPQELRSHRSWRRSTDQSLLRGRFRFQVDDLSHLSLFTSAYLSNLHYEQQIEGYSVQQTKS